MINKVDFVFNIINLCIIFFIIIYAFKKYFLISIKESIVKQNQDLEDLVNKLSNLNEKQILADNDILDQENESKKLIIKIDNWKKSIDNLEIQKKLDQEELAKKFEEKLVKQYNNYQIKRLNKQVVPELTAKLAKDLELLFFDKLNSDKYFTNIIDQLNKSN